MSGSGREILPEVQKWSGVPPKGLGGHPGYPEVVGRPSRRSGSGWEDLPEVQEWSGCSHGGSRVVRKPS